MWCMGMHGPEEPGVERKIWSGVSGRLAELVWVGRRLSEVSIGFESEEN